MLEAMKSLRDETQSMKKTVKEVEVDQTPASASKPGTSKQTDTLPPNTAPNTQPSEHMDEAMELDLYGPPLPPQFGHAQFQHGSDPNHGLDHQSDQSRAIKHSDKRKHKVRAKYVSQSSSSQEDQSSVHMKRSSKPPRAPSEQDQPQHDPDPLFYREVAMAELPSQYTEEVETFRHIRDLPDPRETMPRSSTSVLGLDDQKGQKELRPRGSSSVLPLSSHIKYAFDKFEQDFLASNLPEDKYIKPPPSTAKWYKVGQSCFKDKIQDFSKICISPKPSGAPMGKVPLPVLKELEHQARQNLSTINSQLPLLRLLLPATLLWRSANTVLNLPSKRLKARFRKLPILKKQPGGVMITPVTILRF